MQSAKGIILPSIISDAFKPITYQMPVGMLPIVNKPLMEHQIELFVRYGLKQVHLSCNHLSNKVEGYFDTGSRWGANILYNFERPPFGSINALRQMKPAFDNESLVILLSDVVTDINLAELLEFHKARRADATFVLSASPDARGLSVTLEDNGRIHTVGTSMQATARRHPVDVGVCIIEAELLDFLNETIGYSLLQACWLASQTASMNLFGYVPKEGITRVTNWSSYMRVQQEILDNVYPGIIIPGIQLQPGVWVGKNISASSAVSFEAPLVIGDNCRIGKGVSLGKGTIIGHDVMVDVGAQLHRAIILSKTFVGPQTIIRDSIIQGHLAIDVEKDSFTAIDDRLAALEIESPRIGYKSYMVLNRIAAWLIYVALSPFLLLLFLFMIVGLKFPLISRVKRITPDLRSLAAGKLQLKVIDLIYLGPVDLTQRPVGYNPDPCTTLPHLLARIGNLTNVAKGDVMLVGNRPMDPEIAFSITEEWRRTRFKCQGGIVSILDTNEIDETTDEEQVIAEGYYAVHRSVWMDISVLVRGLWRLFWRTIGVKKVVREYRPVPQEEPLGAD